MQCDYFLGFWDKSFYHLKDAFLQRKWPKEVSNSKDDLYKSFWLVYSREIKKQNHHF
jgi:hypothetical protein